MNRTGQRLDQRRQSKINRTRQAMQVLGRRQHQFSCGAVGAPDPGAVPVLAEIAVSGHAERAFAAVEGGVDGHRVSGGHLGDLMTNADNSPRCLVPRHYRKNRGCEFTIEYVEIGSTDSDRLDLNYSIAWTGYGIRKLSQRELTGPREDDRSHYRLQILQRADITDAPRLH